MKMKCYILPILLLFLFCSSCTSDTLPEPSIVDCPTVITYTTDVKAIIDNTCSYAGCHVSGFGPGNYSSFAGMQAAINSGSFERRVVTQQNMPPSYAPDDRPKELTAEEQEIVQCWIEGGYTE